MPIVYDDSLLEERIIPLVTGGNALMTTDQKYGQVYLYLDPATKGEKGIVKRTEQHASGVNFDYDEQDRLIGIEIY